ncbi:Gfo/Idh/MocA family oxidoreductase [Bacillus sp. AFS001701]|uniref:Gfo/Idh/MocA family protein n=1 Tax=Bacillus sp. AFS001701 TaxID=2033480 RepID=UPI002571279C|nr:Gfo/Idh/MocA family oxidoreductase [Bacillus sp. AFS001701]
MSIQNFLSKITYNLVLCTRSNETLDHLSNKYRINETVNTVDELLEKNIDAAFVTTATEAHYMITKKLLLNGINVYIDKPISMNFKETEQIVNLAKEQGKIAMVGFNRRFTPRVKELTMHGKASLIIMQKNRFNFPEYTRRFVVEDFIHVVDTLRYLMATNVVDLKVNFLKKDSMLEHLVIHLIGEGCTAIGIMNRNNGVTEEIIEYMTPQNKYVVSSLVETTHYHNKKSILQNMVIGNQPYINVGFTKLLITFLTV